MSSIAGKALVVIVAVLLSAAGARAATVYRWTDADGTIHFGDTPPAHGGQVQTEDLPDAPPRSGADDRDRRTPPATGATPGGPAHVALSDQHAEAISGDVQVFRGKLKNEGGTEARDVSVAIRVTEPTQGDECLHDRIDVEPSTLAPGAEATFEAQFQSPCFYGETQADLHAEWR